MSIKIPSNFGFDVDLDLGLDISGIPTAYGIGITSLPKINIGFDPIEIKPIDMSFRIKEIPSVRMSLPADFKVCLGLLGFEMASIRLCGQGQVITESYVANPCECRGRPPGIAIAAVTDIDGAPVQAE